MVIKSQETTQGNPDFAALTESPGAGNEEESQPLATETSEDKARELYISIYTKYPG